MTLSSLSRRLPLLIGLSAIALMPSLPAAAQATAASAARELMMIVGRVIKASTSPPTTGQPRPRPPPSVKFQSVNGMSIATPFIKIAAPSKPKTIEGTAARLLILIWISTG